MNRLLTFLTAPALALGALVGTATLVPQAAKADDHRGHHWRGHHGGGHHHGHWRHRHWHGPRHHPHAYWRPRPAPYYAAYYPQPVYWQPGPLLPATPYYYGSGLSLVLNVPVR